MESQCYYEGYCTVGVAKLSKLVPLIQIYVAADEILNNSTAL